MTERMNNDRNENEASVTKSILPEDDIKSTGEEFEDILQAAGGMGRFQILLILIVVGSKFALACGMLLMAFGGKIPDWWCVDPSNSTGELYQMCEVNGTQCSSVRYSGEIVTVVSQFNLICDRKQLSALIMSIQLVGVLIGCFFTGQLADLYGRKKVFFALIAAHALLCACSAFIKTWEVYAAIRFVIGSTVGGVLVLDTGIPVEFTPSRWRSYIPGYPSWAFGEAFFALGAYLTKDWRDMSIATGVLTALFLFGWIVVPESMRWLLAHGKIDEATAVIAQMAKINGKECPDVSRLKQAAAVEMSKPDIKDRKYTYVDLMRRWNMLKLSLPVMFMWCSMGLTSYGISFGVVALSGSIYVNLFISGFVGLPGSLITIYTNNAFGRRWTVGVAAFLSGLSAMLVVLISYLDIDNKGSFISGLAMTSKLFCSATWLALKLQTAEMYPTVVRNLGLGLGNTASRIGGIIAPQLIYLTQLRGSLMYLVMGVLMVSSAVMTLSLPETRGEALQDVLDPERKMTKVQRKPIVA